MLDICGAQAALFLKNKKLVPKKEEFTKKIRSSKDAKHFLFDS